MRFSFFLIPIVAATIALVGCEPAPQSLQPVSPEQAAELDRQALKGRPEALRIHEQTGQGIVSIPVEPYPIEP